jgi:hypothetical protein
MFEERKIRKKAVASYGLEDDARLEKAVSLVYKAWPAVAREFGSYSNEAIKPQFIAKLYTLTNLKGAYLQGIANAIRDLYGNGELSQEFYSPAMSGQLAQVAKTESQIQAKESGSFLDRLTGGDGITGALDTVKTYIKWGGIALAVVAAIAAAIWLWSITKPVRMGLSKAKTAAKLLGKSKQTEETEEE